jgi:hypothetical protein
VQSAGVQPAPAAVIGQRSSAVVGTYVKLPDGQRVGRVEDLMINEDGCVDFMVVSFDGSSEFRGRLAAIPWSVGKMDFGARAVTLNVERDTLREAPIFFSRGTAWPNLYEPQWATSVHNYFGVQTDIDQRVERAYGTPDSRESRGNRNMDMRRDERGRDMPQPRDLEQRRQIQQPSDRHLDAKPKPVPMPDGNLAPDQSLNRNGERTVKPKPDGNLAPDQSLDRNGERTNRGKERNTLRNNNDDEFSGKKTDREKDRAKNQDSKNDEDSNKKDRGQEDDSLRRPE